MVIDIKILLVYLESAWVKEKVDLVLVVKIFLLEEGNQFEVIEILPIW